MTTTPANLDAFAQAVQDSGCLALREVARELTRLLDEVLAPTGVRATDLGILRVCEMSGPIRMQDLARGLESSQAMVRRRIRPLLKRGLVVMRPQPGRSEALLELTAQGQAALLQGITCWDTVQERLIEQLGVQRWDRIQQQFAAFAGLTT